MFRDLWWHQNSDLCGLSNRSLADNPGSSMTNRKGRCGNPAVQIIQSPELLEDIMWSHVLTGHQSQAYTLQPNNPFRWWYQSWRRWNKRESHTLLRRRNNCLSYINSRRKPLPEDPGHLGWKIHGLRRRSRSHHHQQNHPQSTKPGPLRCSMKVSTLTLTKVTSLSQNYRNLWQAAIILISGDCIWPDHTESEWISPAMEVQVQGLHKFTDGQRSPPSGPALFGMQEGWGL
jgi:hypothetical protein